MTQAELDREVSSATGESRDTIRRQGFSILPLPDDSFEDEPDAAHAAQATPPHRTTRRWAIACAAVALSCTGCAVVTVADAAVSVAATTVKVGAKVVGATVNVGAAGVKAVTGGSCD